MIPVVLSGGSGTRLWPVSRAAYPKQFCEILDESLMQKALRRAAAFGSPWALTVDGLSVLTHRIFKEMKLPSDQILLEPFGRNTAPAVALLCRALQLRGLGKEVVAVFPADHLTMKEDEFARVIRLAETCARKRQVVTLGIKPDHPATGFGYIETKAGKFEEQGSLAAYRVAGFREKPSEATARQFIDSGNFCWNAGIFIFEVETMAAHFETQTPELWSLMMSLEPDLSNMKAVYVKAPNISIDYAIMEKITEQVSIPCDIGWSDLGSWDDVAKYSDPAHGLQTSNRAEAFMHESRNCYAFSPDNKVFGIVGLEDVLIIDTPDACLVVRKGHSQDVRKIVEALNSRGHSAALGHRYEERPWGAFEVLRDEPHFKSKVITVDPGQQISYQSHAKRAEHWVMVRGTGEVVLNEKVIPVKRGDSVFIPLGAKHRIRNTGEDLLEFVEVQTGTYFGEDDIVRYEDDYNRV